MDHFGNVENPTSSRRYHLAYYASVCHRDTRSTTQGEQMRTVEVAGFTKGMRPVIIGLLLTGVTAAPFVGPTVAGAISGRTAEATAQVTLTAHATLDCGPITFMFDTDNPVSYFQIHATGVGCAVAKNVVVKGGKYHAQPPAGWTYVTSGTLGASNCFITWKRGAARVTAYRVNGGAGC
jgi:hypothetical protein